MENKNEEEMTKNEKIVAGAKQVANGWTEVAPQYDEEGNLNYYFSGSLAMLLLNSAQSYQAFVYDGKGKIKKSKNKVVLKDKSKEALAKGVRPISVDVDVVSVGEYGLCSGGNLKRNAALQKVVNNCELAKDLCPKWGKGFFLGYFDELAAERAISLHNVVEIIMEDGTKAVITDPHVLIMHKFAESIIVRKKGFDDKYEKDLKDFSSMFNAIAPLNKNYDYKQLLQTVLENSEGSALERIFVGDDEDCDRMKQFYADVLELIDDENKEEFFSFVKTMGQENRRIAKENNAMSM